MPIYIILPRVWAIHLENFSLSAKTIVFEMWSSRKFN